MSGSRGVSGATYPGVRRPASGFAAGPRVTTARVRGIVGSPASNPPLAHPPVCRSGVFSMSLPGRALFTLSALVFALPAAAQDKGKGRDMDGIEEKITARAAERASRSADGERGRWVKVLNKAYPGRVPEVATAADLDRWFDLLADGGREWRREDGPAAELFDRVTERLELGPV